ncbi:hypothetical protein SUGI_0581060 [Cryptomeria japonica]|uniref:uncharacterized protein LOC131048086 n=1 Tax=Cryptomeria japonica TaxID=3369 RepID=UPI002414AC5A|nr:uncharacterized protein LOC131048086 [Cryptomeria japonica]GLJ29477.1 hypothetical protein SUGI_0581060 [Cryptomeria japonica]
MARPMHKTHIPGFGNWDVANNNEIITEYFEIARAGKEKREGNGKGHVQSHPEREPGIPRSSNIADGNADIRNGRKIKVVQRAANNTARQTEAIPIKAPKSFPAASGQMRANDSGQVLMHLPAVHTPTASQNLVAQHRVPAPIRPSRSAPLGPKESEVYQVKSGIRKENYQRGFRSRTEMDPSVWTQKEYGRSRTPSPSHSRPSNAHREFGAGKPPSPSYIRPSNARREFGVSKTPSPLFSRPGNEKPSSNKNHRKKALPKFGDWDSNDPAAGIAFTSIFNEARNEKKEAASAIKTPSQMDAATPKDEDLYKQPSNSHKRHGVKLISIISKIFSGKMICQ